MTEPRPFRALVVEDEWPARNYLVELLEGSGLARVVAAVASLEEARQALSPQSSLDVDVAFVDVNIASSGADAGLAFVRERSAANDPPAFVLATAFKQHALEAFDLGVVDYLLKPFTEERVIECLVRLGLRRRSARSPTVPSRIVARAGKKLVFLDPNEVWAFESSERLTSVHTLHGQFDVDLSLANIESTLGSQFSRVHRSWLVNALFIRELSRDGSETSIFVGTGLGSEHKGIVVPVARERAQGVREMLLEGATGLRKS